MKRAPWLLVIALASFVLMLLAGCGENSDGSGSRNGTILDRTAAIRR